MSTTLYGISNCDTVRKARRWLDEQQVDYHFHDFRVDGTDRALIERWLQSCAWEDLINRRSTSWKALSATQRDTMDAAAAITAVLATPTLVKRPVLERDGKLELGFHVDRYRELLGVS